MYFQLKCYVFALLDASKEISPEGNVEETK
jgi:hypothetical protein